jgi:alkylated DNA repair dioxygenase AlkB
MLGHQRSLFGWDAPRIDPRFARAERIALDAHSFIERVPGWVDGHERLFEELHTAMRWAAHRRPMYDRVVDVPRLTASAPADGDHPLLGSMSRALSRRYGEDLTSITLALYRSGQDSVAWHRDKEVRDLARATVAIVTLGGPRRFGVRPLGGGPARYLTVGWGDLLVMGGACQRDWEHAVPKVRHAPPRMALMFRHASYSYSEAG